MRLPLLLNAFLALIFLGISLCAIEKEAILENFAQFKKKLTKLDEVHRYEINLSKFFSRLKKCRESKSEKKTIVKKEIQQFLAFYESRTRANNMYYFTGYRCFFDQKYFPECMNNALYPEFFTVNLPERSWNLIYQNLTVNKQESYLNFYPEYICDDPWDARNAANARDVITTALGVAVCTEDQKLVALLLLAGHDPNVKIEAPKNFESTKNQIKTPLQLAIILRNKEIITLLLIAGADKNRKTYFGVSLDEYASRYKGYHDIADLLNNFYINVDIALLQEYGAKY